VILVRYSKYGYAMREKGGGRREEGGGRREEGGGRRGGLECEG
jgi:hypothetical protein